MSFCFSCVCFFSPRLFTYFVVLGTKSGKTLAIIAIISIVYRDYLLKKSIVELEIIDFL